jgi:23S rRNA (uracil1939-C5)-methyltransferase
MWGKSVEVLSGESFLTEVMDGLELLISARSFFQTNTQQARSLYRYVRQQAQILPGQRVFDAYCGTGSIGLYLALQGAQVLGVESNPAAVADAQRNAAHNGLQNTEFVAGSVERELPRRVAHGEKFDLIVLDPPREGCHREVLAALVAARSERIIYVSCNPATLARDLVELVRGGYLVEAVQPVDMFPQTAHVECVVSLIRNL